VASAAAAGAEKQAAAAKVRHGCDLTKSTPQH
jgi:hypothetical protein